MRREPAAPTHMHFPAGGVGLKLGLQDAMNLGWKLAAVVQAALITATTRPDPRTRQRSSSWTPSWMS
ncbi:hypothetical protein GCM10010435_81860 [Winogradskya consettensis]|uniref:FAD-binding domain-containing protein n=1 Tax=Winogradskya consettensis TaxID=113560 RepID=A0A919W465_9ACTN|nr:hypothetical protein Aco04nite_63440 [Actinoplanes consettensis]